ncbi:MAG: AbrB/MazE/SpoVT family DNA-binding domain-containing protein [Thermodesulfobacteriota bacterium]
MSISTLTSKGQITVPKDIRDVLHLRPSDKVLITIEKDHAVLRPIHGNILDIGGSIKIPPEEKPIDFKMVREKTRKIVARKVLKGRK